MTSAGNRKPVNADRDTNTRCRRVVNLTGTSCPIHNRRPQQSRLTPLGASLSKIIAAVRTWAYDNMDEIDKARASFDSRDA